MNETKKNCLIFSRSLSLYLSIYIYIYINNIVSDQLYTQRTTNYFKSFPESNQNQFPTGILQFSAIHQNAEAKDASIDLGKIESSTVCIKPGCMV